MRRQGDKERGKEGGNEVAHVMIESKCRGVGEEVQGREGSSSPCSVPTVCCSLAGKEWE